MKLRLACVALVLFANALPAHAKGRDDCHPIGIAAKQSLVLRNSRSEPVTLSLSFQSEEGGSKSMPVACGSLALEAGQSLDAMSLAQLCPAADGSSAGVLKACVAASATSGSLGVASGDLLDDVMGNKLRVGGQ